jgi:hypothetical protein
MKSISYLFIICLLTLFFLPSCSRKSTPIMLMRPADITLPSDINTILTIDRSKPSSGFWNVVEGLFTGEAIGQDQQGRRRAIESLRINMQRTPRYEVKHSGVELTGSRSGSVFPEPLPWIEVENYCNKYNTDVLLALELFDSDTPMSVRSEVKKDKEGKSYKEYIVNQQVIIRTGWRLYDPKKRIILDEFITSAHRSFSNRGLDSMQVVRTRRWQMEDVRLIAALAGEAYTARVAPIWITESRMFYSKGKNPEKAQFKQANEWIKLGKWEECIPIYESIAKTSLNPKNVGRAAYNLAVAYEQIDQLDKAQEWSEISFIRYRNKQAKHYYERLRKRQFDEQILDRQFQ